MTAPSPIQIEIEAPWAAHVDAERLRHAVAATLAAEGAAPDAALSVAVVGDPEIARLHELFRGEAGPTDVLTFPFEADDEVEGEEMAGYLGDVVIGYEQAARQGAEEGHAVQAELELLAVHGTLHLLGHEDEGDAAAKAAMWAAQRHILGTLGLGHVAPHDES